MPVPGNAAAATAMAANAGVNAQMLELMKEMMTNKRTGGQNGRQDPTEDDLLKDTWHGKLSMLKSGVANLLCFCGLKENQEHLIPIVVLFG